MVPSIVTALLNISKNPNNDLSRVFVIPKSRSSSINRASSMGEGLEFYVKDSFCNTFNISDAMKKNEEYSKSFSYLGTQNNPPDIMLRGGDAIEV